MRFTLKLKTSFFSSGSLLFILTLISCQEGSNPVLNSSDLYDQVEESHYIACVDRVNELRATENLEPLAREQDQELCASQSAQKDSQTGEAHGAFGECGERAQNECPGYPSVETTLANCIDAMWAEKELGPDVPFAQNGHYLNMTSPKYSKISCGFYITEDSKVWMIQNFYP